jgi:hypothetical protein
VRLVIISAVVILLVALALRLRAMPSIGLEELAALALGLLVLGGCIALSLRAGQATRRARDLCVARVDTALRALAERTGAEYSATASYKHPVIGVIPYAGRVEGTLAGRTWRCAFAEGEDERDQQIHFVVLDVPLPTRKPKLKELASSTAARALLQGLLDEKHQVELEVVKPSPRDASAMMGRMWLRLNRRSTRSPDPRALEEVLHRAVNLAGQIGQGCAHFPSR